MIIRCPHCDHTRTINSDKIPPGAELATCPRCKNRFRFRALEKAVAPVFDAPGKKQEGQPGREYRERPGGKTANRSKPAPIASPGSVRVDDNAVRESQVSQGTEQVRPAYAVQEVQRPQSAFREAAEKAGADIWDAVDALHQRWENQIDQHVTEVVTPRPGKGGMPRKEKGSEAIGPRQSAGIGTGDAKQESSLKPDKQEKAFPAMSELYDSMAAEEIDPPHPDPAAPAGIATRTLVNYHEQGSSPEDIVDQDIKILQHSPSEQKPTRDLGKIKAVTEKKDISAPQPEPERITAKEAEQPPAREVQDSHQQQEDEESQVPWENQEEYGGWFKALITTIYFVMFRSPAFFSNLGRAGAPLSYLFFLILGYIAIVSTVLWGEIAMLLIQDVAPLLDNLLTLPILLVIAPLVLGLMQLFVTGCIRLQLKVLAPEQADFATSFRITAYSVAPFVLCLVPFVGPTVGAAWFTFALATGCRYALNLSWGAAVAVTLPPAGLLIGGLCWFFLV